MATRELNILIRAKNLASGAIKGVKAEMKGLDKTLGKGVSSAWKNTEKGIVLGAGAAAAGLGYAVTKAIAFEDAFAGVKKTVDQTDLTKAGMSFQSLSDDIREMSRTMPLAVDDIAAVAESAGALGVKAADIENFTRVASLLGVTTDVNAQDAATALGQLSNVLGLTGDDYERFGSTLVDLGNKGASTESQILEIATRTGSASKLIGLSKDQTLGWSSAVANLGVNVEAGGTAIQKFLLTSLKKVNSSSGLALMAKTAGKTGKAFKQAFEKDANGALVSFIQGLGKLDKAAKLDVLKKMGLTDQRITTVLLGLSENTDNLTNSLKTSNDAWKENNALTAEAQKRFDTTKSKLQVLKNNLDDAAITIGSAVLPEFAALAESATGWLRDHQPEIKSFAQDIAGGLKQAVQWASKLDWNAIGNTLKTVAGVGKTLLETFLGMPSWVQVAIATGWGLNKFTGGAVGSIFGGVVSGVAKAAGKTLLGKLGLMNVQAGVVNVNGGVGGGGPGGGLPKGGILAGMSVAELGTLAAAIALPLIMFDVIPALVPGPKQEGAGAGSQPGLHTRTGDLSPLVVSQMSGLMPSFRTRAAAAGASPIVPKHMDVTDAQVLDTLRREKSDHRAQAREQVQAMRDTSSRITRQIISHAASERSDLRTLQSETRRIPPSLDRIRGATTDAASASRRIPPALSRIEGVERGNSGHLNTIAHKPFSATANVTVNSYATIRVDTLTRALSTHSYVTASGRRGGLIQ